ncbi:MAG: 5-formyltetrahydrofolate cyclo-ligase [Magnetococcales bacterium]|nr:5-formyltetrahydrofolate cyclo-ligase [Magnetococcales bacterium]
MDSSQKGLLRRLLCQQRQQLSVKSVSSLSQVICRHLVVQPFYLSARVIALYWPIRREVDPISLVEWAHTDGKKVVLPVISSVSARQMSFAFLTPGDPLKPGPFGIPEPACVTETISCQEIVTKIDLLLLPVVAFDLQGGRLGYGGGYYDRCLAGITHRHTGKPYLVGLAYQFQQVAALPREPHDVQLDVVVTEQGLCKLVDTF